MRLLLVNSFYDPTSVGGSERSVKVLAESMVGLGCEVAVFTIDGAAASQLPDEVDGVKVHRLPASWFGPDLYLERGNRPRKLKALIRGVHNREAGKAFARFCAVWKPDLIHTNSLYGLSYTVWGAAKAVNIPVVHTLRDYALIDPRGVIGLTPNPIRLAHEHQTHHLAARHLAYVTAPSQRTLDAHLERGFFANTPLARIPNCIAFEPSAVERMATEKCDRTNPEIRLLYAGTLAEYKGLDTLLEAFARTAGPNLRLEICGSGRMESEVIRAERGDSRIHFWGQLRPASVQERMEQCDVMVVPSMWDEPFGRVVIEAFANALPVIGSDRGGVGEILRGSSGGLVFRSGDVEALCDAIVAVAERSELPNLIHGATESLPEFSVERHAADFSRVYESAIQGHASGSGGST